MARVVVYSTPTCTYCDLAKEWLKKKNIPYQELDVSVDEKAATDMIEKSGQMSVPVLEVDGQIIIGFNKPALQKALGLE